MTSTVDPGHVMTDPVTIGLMATAMPPDGGTKLKNLNGSPGRTNLGTGRW